MLKKDLPVRSSVAKRSGHTPTCVTAAGVDEDAAAACTCKTFILQSLRQTAHLSDDSCCHHTLLSVPGLYEGIFQSCKAAAASMGISYPWHRPIELWSQLKAPPKALQVLLDTKQCARDFIARRIHISL